MYISFTDEVKSKIQSTENYPVLDLDINVDGTACLLIKNINGKYYTAKVSYSEMKMSVESLSNLIIRRANLELS